MSNFWWPLDLSERAERIFEDTREYFEKERQQLDWESAKSVNHLSSRLMKTNLEEIIERDSLPNLCHIINGWGNAAVNNEHLLDYFEDFVHYDDKNRPHILQCLPEGDFHPWQSFAYSVMAGIDGGEKFGKRQHTLAEVAENSRYINHKDGEELGHLLFALSFLEDKKDIKPFEFRDRDNADLEELMEWATTTHVEGTFRVCRKFHLTEGLCAISTRINGFESYQEIAPYFLEGQLNMIYLLSIILDEAIKAIDEKHDIKEDSVAYELREVMAIRDYFENHLYYAGHIIELATFAHLLGFEMSNGHRNAIIKVINQLNTLFPKYIPSLSFSEAFLGIGHYRRSVTLLMEILEREEKGEAMDWEMLKNYTVDFNKLQPISFTEQEIEESERLVGLKVFKLSAPSEATNDYLQEIIDEYEELSPSKEFMLRSKFPHFRRVLPKGWPRSVHFELLDYESSSEKIGLEFHLESEEVKFLQASLGELKDVLSEEFSEYEVIEDHDWYHGKGRVKIDLPYNAGADTTAKAFLKFVEVSYPLIQQKLENHFSQLQEAAVS
ncbi:hypothetical protein [Fulvivirga sediminis]|uniref:Uncharacterized protein n=1 Tax=Fulvivirga sediminis TaxID=2803949 RepID=A0A937FE07_9BACT|nr:hypothetical protein [Fulvivirga sediminis]MBL3659029.1 hypothetical protein [Fulvivirga sediminis]